MLKVLNSWHSHKISYAIYGESGVVAIDFDWAGSFSMGVFGASDTMFVDGEGSLAFVAAPIVLDAGAGEVGGFKSS